MKRKRKNNYRILNGPAGNVSGIMDMKPYNFKETDENSVEVEMYGQVVENRPIDWRTGKSSDGLYIVLAEFLKDLDTYKEKDNITFRINSVGGDLFAGITIYNRISELKGNTVTIVDGLAASAASIILQAGKKRKAFAGSQVMIHGASVFMFGSYNQQDLKKVENRLDGGNKSALETYVSRTGKDKAFLKELMDKEDWMTGQEAIEKGLVDELIETENHVNLSMSADGKMVMSNGIWMPMEGFRNVPKGPIPVMEVATVPVTGMAVINENKNETGGEKAMTVAEMRQKYPEAVQQIENEAVENAQGGNSEEQIRNDAIRQERERMKAIGEIENQIADKKLVNEAKYGNNPMTAQELAFAAMKQQQNIGQQFLNNLQDDAAQSGTGNVTPTPNAGTKTPEEQELEDDANGAALIAGAWK